MERQHIQLIGIYTCRQLNFEPLVQLADSVKAFNICSDCHSLKQAQFIYELFHKWLSQKLHLDTFSQ